MPKSTVRTTISLNAVLGRYCDAPDPEVSHYRAKQRLSAGRARDHPVMEIVPNRGGGRLTRGVGDRDRELAAGSLVNSYFL